MDASLLNFRKRRRPPCPTPREPKLKRSPVALLKRRNKNNEASQVLRRLANPTQRESLAARLLRDSVMRHHEKSVKSLVHAMASNCPQIVVLGEPGTGKSTLPLIVLNNLNYVPWIISPDMTTDDAATVLRDANQARDAIVADDVDTMPRTLRIMLVNASSRRVIFTARSIITFKDGKKMAQVPLRVLSDAEIQRSLVGQGPVDQTRIRQIREVRGNIRAAFLILEFGFAEEGDIDNKLNTLQSTKRILSRSVAMHDRFRAVENEHSVNLLRKNFIPRQLDQAAHLSQIFSDADLFKQASAQIPLLAEIASFGAAQQTSAPTSRSSRCNFLKTTQPKLYEIFSFNNNTNIY